MISKKRKQETALDASNLEVLKEVEFEDKSSNFNRTANNSLQRQSNLVPTLNDEQLKLNSSRKTMGLVSGQQTENPSPRKQVTKTKVALVTSQQVIEAMTPRKRQE